MVASILSRFAILVFGILYPAYSSFKAVRRKSHRDYTKWMMYWIVFALFQTLEMVTDIFLPWLPLYYELKIIIVLWLALPIFEGSKQMYRLIVHPFLVRHEERIDQGIAQAGRTGFDTIKKVSQAGLNKAATTFVTSAIMGQNAIQETLQRVADQQQGPAVGGAVGGAGEGGQEMVDHSFADSSPREEAFLTDGQLTQRSRVLSSDLEPFEVIGEELPEVVHHPPAKMEEGFWESSQRKLAAVSGGEGVWSGDTGEVYTTSSGEDVSNSVYHQSTDYLDRTLPRPQS